MEFKIGDRVRSLDTHRCKKIGVGLIGTIKILYGNCFGVEFDENIFGHTCSGTTKNGYGYWLMQYDIELVEEDTQNTQNLKELLVDNSIVEIVFYKEHRIGVVRESGDVIMTSYGRHMIDWYDEDLICKSTPRTDKINKIYHQTDKGLELVWDRDTFVDWSKVEIDTKIQVKLDNGNWVNKYFAKYEDGNVYTFPFGRTSFTSNSHEMYCTKENARLYVED